MSKYLLGVIVGVFAGAFVIELLDKKSGVLGRAKSGAQKLAKDVRRAFAEGYHGGASRDERPPLSH